MTITEIWFKTAELFIEFLKVVCSWPVAVFALIIYFLKRYKDSIENLISRINEANLTGVRFEPAQVAKLVEQREELIEEISEKEDAKEKTLQAMLEVAQQRSAEAEERIANYRADLKSKETEINELRGRDWSLAQQLEDISIKNDLLQMASSQRNLLRSIWAKVIAKSKSGSVDPTGDIIKKFSANNNIRVQLLNMGIIDPNGAVTQRGEKIISMVGECWK